VWFALSPTARAQLSPAPDGGYAGHNTAEGTDPLFMLTTGIDNTAIGTAALFNNTTGSENTATGYLALEHNNTGAANTANGSEALFSNTTGGFNTANGFDALLRNTTGGSNTANGASALSTNTTGFANTASGVDALFSNTTGGSNTASGAEALFNNTTGARGTANGLDALLHNTTGNNNTADGVNALFNNTTGSSNIALGFAAGSNLTNGSNNIDIGNAGVAGDASKIRIGRQGTQNGTFIAGISGIGVSGSPVLVSTTGKLGVMSSSARFKQAIKPMDKTSEAILALNPVTFRYKGEIDPDGVPQFGLIAEQVEKVSPDLVVRDEDGKVSTVRYEAVNAMLLNEFLKAHRKVEQQGAAIAQQRKDFESKIAQQQKQIETLTATVQKVSDQFELHKRAPRVVANER
jgi:hypothetical protein